MNPTLTASGVDVGMSGRATTELTRAIAELALTAGAPAPLSRREGWRRLFDLSYGARANAADALAEQARSAGRAIRQSR